MIHADVATSLARWAGTAPRLVDQVLAFLWRYLPHVHADASDALNRGARIRLIVDLDGGSVSRVRVRLLRSGIDDRRNSTLFTAQPPVE